MTKVNNITKKRLIYAILILIWMAVVFAFSNQPSEESSKSSGGITETIVRMISKEPEKYPKEKKEIIETIVRKTAHLTIYAIGGFLSAGLIYTTKVKNKQIFLYAVLFTAIYACTDEIHQYFIPGRSCELRDVLIDSLGATLGTVIFLWIKNLPINNSYDILQKN